MKRIIIIILALLIVMPSAFATKRAFLVGINKYKTGWTRIHGSDDVKLLDSALKENGFKVKTLTDEQATYDDILKGLDTLKKQIKKKDIVYIHFSTHGQPVEDYNGDEKDKWDESIVPYDAGSRYSDAYKGEKHIIDDVINKYVSEIRTILGPKGALYVVIDACHAGDLSRGPFETTRGTNVGFSRSKEYKIKEGDKETHYTLEKRADLAPTLFLEACRSNERNTEISVKVKDKVKEYGSLSYMVYLALNKSKIGSDPRDFEKVVKDVVNKEKAPNTNKKLWPKTQTLVTETSY